MLIIIFFQVLEWAPKLRAFVDGILKGSSNMLGPSWGKPGAKEQKTHVTSTKCVFSTRPLFKKLLLSYFYLLTFCAKSYFLSLFDTFLTFYASSHVLTSFFPKSFPWRKKSMFSKLKAFARRARHLEAIPIIIIKNEAVSVPTSRMFCPANVQLHLDDYKTI